MRMIKAKEGFIIQRMMESYMIIAIGEESEFVKYNSNPVLFGLKSKTYR